MKGAFEPPFLLATSNKYVVARHTLLDSSGGLLKEIIIEDTSDPLSDVIMRTSQNDDPIFDYVKRVREVQADAEFITGQTSSMKHVAFLGIEVLQRMAEENWDEDDLRKFLNDTNYKKLRTWEGRI